MGLIFLLIGLVWFKSMDANNRIQNLNGGNEKKTASLIFLFLLSRLGDHGTFAAMVKFEFLKNFFSFNFFVKIEVK